MQNLTYSSLFLAVIEPLTLILAIVLSIAVGVGAGIFFGMYLKNKSFIKKQGDIKLPSTKFVNIGLSIENLLGVKINSLPVADINGIELFCASDDFLIFSV